MTTDAAATDPADVHPDSRTTRTVEALRVAILRLAAEQHVDRLSVAQIAQAAEIHRVTFYDHARSPSALLARVIRDELERVRQDSFASGVAREPSLHESVRHTALGVAALVESHRAIFTHLLAEHSRTTAHDLLAPHFEQTLGELISARTAAEETAPQGAPLPNADAALARYVAYGSVGAMEVWFAGDPARDPENYYRLIEPLLPDWLVA
ncbi:MAG: TetR-like C-terminal domain-containing protein [Cryobacterium sp.]